MAIADWRYGRPRTADLAMVLGLLLLALFLARAPLTWAVAGLAGAALFCAIAIEPAVGPIAIALAIPFGHLAPLPLPGGVGAVDLLVALTVAAWLARGIARRALIFRPPALTWPILALVWVLGLSLTQAISWREGLPEWLKWAEFAALYLVATQILERRQVWWVVGALFAAGLAEAALGAYQFVRQAGPEAFVLMGRFMRAYGTFRQPNPYAGYLGYLAPVAASLALGALGRWWAGRGATADENSSGGSHTCGVPWPAWPCQGGLSRAAARSGMGARPAGTGSPQKPALSLPKGRGAGGAIFRTDFWLGLVCSGVAIALIAGIGLSWSRGAWLGLAAGLLVVLGFRSRRATLLTTGGLLALALIIALFGRAVTARLNDLGNYVAGPDPARTEITDANFAVLERMAHWQAALKMFDDHPWLGVGIGNYAVAYAAYALPHWYEPLGHAHNVYLNFLGETGALGAGAFALFWLSAVWFVWRQGKRPPDPPIVGGIRLPPKRCPEPAEGLGGRGGQSALAIGVLGTLVYLSVHSLFDNLFVSHIQLQLALLLGGLAVQKDNTV